MTWSQYYSLNLYYPFRVWPNNVYWRVGPLQWTSTSISEKLHGPLPFCLSAFCPKRPLGWRHHLLLPIIQIQLLAVPATNNATLLATFICGQMVIASHTTPGRYNEQGQNATSDYLALRSLYMPVTLYYINVPVINNKYIVQSKNYFIYMVRLLNWWCLSVCKSTIRRRFLPQVAPLMLLYILVSQCLSTSKPGSQQVAVSCEFHTTPSWKRFLHKLLGHACSMQ
jgi:hypothetical protein